MHSAADEHTVTSAEIEGIHDGDDALLPDSHLTRCSRMTVEVPSQRLGVHAMLGSEIREGMTLARIEVISSRNPSRTNTMGTLKNSSTLQALISLTIIATSVLSCLQRMASATAFFMMNFEEEIQKALLIVQKGKAPRNINQKCPLPQKNLLPLSGWRRSERRGGQGGEAKTRLLVRHATVTSLHRYTS